MAPAVAPAVAAWRLEADNADAVAAGAREEEEDSPLPLERLELLDLRSLELLIATWREHSALQVRYGIIAGGLPS